MVRKGRERENIVLLTWIPSLQLCKTRRDRKRRERYWCERIILHSPETVTHGFSGDFESSLIQMPNFVFSVSQAMCESWRVDWRKNSSKRSERNLTRVHALLFPTCIRTNPALLHYYWLVLTSQSRAAQPIPMHGGGILYENGWGKPFMSHNQYSQCNLYNYF